MAVRDGRLREDLYYRLGVVPIHIPPLRQRPEDVPILARHFLSGYWQRHRGTGTPAPHLTDTAIRHLQERSWKGNVRELQNVIEHAIVLADGRDTIDATDLPQFGGGAVSDYMSEGWPASGGDEPGRYHETRERVIARFEKDYLTRILRETEGNVSEAARVAGVNRATLYRLLERHGLTRNDLVQ
jgi:DNA-binding NtrC family response regulator